MSATPIPPRRRHPDPARAAALIRCARMAQSPSDDSEHDRLMRMTEALEREHEALHGRPDDLEAHAAHRDKLRQHIQELHAYIDRLKTRDR